MITLIPQVRVFSFALLLLLFNFPLLGFRQEKQQVANFSVGKYETKNYEHLSFWVESGHRNKIEYSYGKDAKEIAVGYLGVDTFNNAKCVKLQFTNGLVLYVIPKGLTLHIVDADGKYSKIFRWEYEGPVDGRGMTCTICVEGDRDAINFVKKYFLK